MSALTSAAIASATADGIGTIIIIIATAGRSIKNTGTADVMRAQVSLAMKYVDA
jgi:hypothetical protein